MGSTVGKCEGAGVDEHMQDPTEENVPSAQGRHSISISPALGLYVFERHVTHEPLALSMYDPQSQIFDGAAVGLVLG